MCHRASMYKQEAFQPIFLHTLINIHLHLMILAKLFINYKMKLKYLPHMSYIPNDDATIYTKTLKYYRTSDYTSGPRLNIKTVLSTYGDFHVKDKTAVRTSYL